MMISLILSSHKVRVSEFMQHKENCCNLTHITNNPICLFFPLVIPTLIVTYERMGMGPIFIVFDMTHNSHPSSLPIGHKVTLQQSRFCNAWTTRLDMDVIWTDILRNNAAASPFNGTEE